MGQEIVYCSRCQIRLTTADFQSGKAFRWTGTVFCKKCAPPEAVAAVPQVSTSDRLKAQPAPAPRPPTRRLIVERRAGALPWIVAGSAVAIGIIATIAGLASSRAPEPVPPPVERPEPTPAARPTPPDSALDATLAREAELAELQARARQAQEKEEFRKAMDLLEKGLKRAGSPAERGPLDRQLTEVRRAAEQLFQDVRTKAVDATRRGAEEEARALARRVEAWGLPDLRADLDRALDEPRKDAAARAGWVIFADALGPGWQDWSWSTQRSFANASPVAEGTHSISARFEAAYAGLFLHSGKLLEGDQLAALVFQAQGTQKGQAIRVSFYDDKNKVILEINLKGADVPPVGSWKRYHLPLDTLARRKISGLAIIESSGKVPSTLYVDGLSLLRRSP